MSQPHCLRAYLTADACVADEQNEHRFTRIGPAKGVGPSEQVLSRLHSELVRDSLVSHGYAVSAAADAPQVAKTKFKKRGGQINKKSECML